MNTMGELVDNLFRTKRKTNGREYTYKEVCVGVGGAIDPSYLSKLRNGQIDNPGRDTLLYLCRFFKVPPSYFFPELEPPDTETEYREDPIRMAARLAARGSGVSVAVQQKLEELLKAMRGDTKEEE
jgi:transcriptional regulator with XRE-family HTH domain